MKKVILAALMLVLITSVAWAKEITLTAETDGRTVVAPAESGAVTVPVKGEPNAGLILFWDDGVMDDDWQDSYSRAVQFTAPLDCHVSQSMVYLYDEQGLLVPVYFAIYDDNAGLPGDELGGVLTVCGGSMGWHVINAIPAGITLTEGDVFYGVVVKHNDGHPYLCADTSEPIHGYFYSDGTEWVADETSNFMLRLVVDDDMTGPFSENPNPAPGDTGVDGDTTVSFELHDSNCDIVPESLVVVIDETDVSDMCVLSMLIDGGCIVTFKPEKGFDNGEIYVYWYAEDELGNGAEDTWSFTVEDDAEGSNTEETTWGVIKDTF
jgi:hypothetical protein